MKRKALPLIAVLLAACLLVLSAALFFGRQAGGQKPAWDEAALFHAEIVARDGAFFHVNGLSCNDVNGRGEFTFTVGEDTPLLWRHTPITLEDLQPGGRVAVTYAGDVLETYPAQLTQVLKIELLEDEK